MGFLLERPRGAKVLLVLAHGAGVGMTHPFMAAVACELAARKVATLRFNFPYMDAGRKRTDPPEVAKAAIAEAVERSRKEELPLALGGKSFGGRMSSQLMAEAPPPGVGRLVFLGFPLHEPGKPGTERAAHLPEVKVPMLFVQGTRDDLADLSLLTPICRKLNATLHIVDGGDHSFAVLKRSGRKQDEVLAEIGDTIAEFLL